MTEMSEYGVYELLLSRMLEQVKTVASQGDVFTDVSALYQRALASHNRTIAQRCFERATADLCERLGLRLVILFDEFDELLEKLDHRFFLSLRGLRDDFKYRVCYVVATRRAPASIREDIAQACEPFYELLTLHVYGLKPYSRDDALEMVERLARRHNTGVPEGVARRLIALTGGHPGLLVAVFEVARREGWPSPAAYGVDRYVEDGDVQEECLKIWGSIDEDEQNRLRRIAYRQPRPRADDDWIGHLKAKGLISEDENTRDISLFAPIFTHYVLGQGPVEEEPCPEEPAATGRSAL
jgi:hypothetical protein